MNYYKYFFYRIYNLALWSSSTDIPAGKAHIMLTLIGGLDIVGIYSILSVNQIEVLPSNPLYAKIMLVAIFGTLLLLNYLICIKNREYYRIKEHFESFEVQNTFEFGIANFAFLIYCTFWLASLIACAIIVRG